LNRQLELNIALLTVGGHCIVALTHGGPVAVPDVPSYLAVAQWLHGGQLPNPLAYFPGYGLLLSPFGGFSGNDLHTVALLFNAALAGLVVLLAAQFAKRIGAPRNLVLATSIIAAVHPSLTSASRIAWPETLIAALVLLVCVALCSENVWVCCAMSFAAGLSFAVHPRLVALIFALTLAAFLAKRLKLVACSLIPGLMVALLVINRTQSWPSGRIDAAQALPTGSNPMALIAGAVIVLCACTMSIGFVAIQHGIKKLFSRGRRNNAEISQIFVMVSAVTMICLGAWVLAGGSQPDILLYGRYIDPWVLPLLVVGLVQVGKAPISSKYFLLYFGVIAISGLVIVLSVDEYGHAGRRIMTQSLGLLWAVCDESVLGVGLLAILLSITALVITRCDSGIRVPALVLGIICLAIPSTIMNHLHLQKVGEVADGQIEAINSVPKSVSCLSHDIQSTKSYSVLLYRLQRPNISHERISLEGNDTPCSGYVIAGIDSLSTCSGASLVERERRATWGLWKYPLEGCD
jgi:hypothetical protein